MTGKDVLADVRQEVKYIRHQQLVDLRAFHQVWVARDGVPYATVEELWVRYVHWILQERPTPPLELRPFCQHRLVRVMAPRKGNLGTQSVPQDRPWRICAAAVQEAWPRLMAGTCTLRFMLKVEIV